MIDTVASILAPLLGLAGSAGADAAVSLPFQPTTAGNKTLASDPGLHAPIVLPSIQFAANTAAAGVGGTALAPEPAEASMAPAAASSAAAPMNTRADAEAAPPVTPDNALLEGRRRPGFQKDLPERIEQMNLGAVRPPPPEAFYGDRKSNV